MPTEDPSALSPLPDSTPDPSLNSSEEEIEGSKKLESEGSKATFLSPVLITESEIELIAKFKARLSNPKDAYNGKVRIRALARLHNIRHKPNYHEQLTEIWKQWLRREEIAPSTTYPKLIEACLDLEQAQNFAEVVAILKETTFEEEAKELSAQSEKSPSHVLKIAACHANMRIFKEQLSNPETRMPMSSFRHILNALKLPAYEDEWDDLWALWLGKQKYIDIDKCKSTIQTLENTFQLSNLEEQITQHNSAYV